MTCLLVAVVTVPGGDGVSVLLVDTVHSSHRDLLDVLLLDPHVGAFDRHRDATVQRPEARDDLEERERERSECRV